MKIASLLLAAVSAATLAVAAQAADLEQPSPMPTPSPMVASTYNWTGLYVGLQGGYVWSHSHSTYDDPDLQTNFPLADVNADGLAGGLAAGANYQFASGFVVGIEGDFTFADLTDTIPDDAGITLNSNPDAVITSTTDYAATIRGRVGMAVHRTLLFGTAGYALSHATVHATDGDISDDALLSGWTVGGGIEQAVTDKVSVKLEYLYTATGDHTWFEGEDWSSTSSSSASTLRAGLNLHF